MKKEKPDGQLTSAQVKLIRSVERAKPRAALLDEDDEADFQDRSFTKLFDDPEK